MSRLALVARSRDKLEEVAAACRGNGAKEVLLLLLLHLACFKVLLLSLDLMLEEACKQAVKDTVDHFGGDVILLISCQFMSFLSQLCYVTPVQLWTCWSTLLVF